VTVRALPLHSLRLGISGQADVVEFHALEPGDGAGAVLEDRAGRWRPCRSSTSGEAEKENLRPGAGLRPGLCLEEMLGAAVPEAALFYATPRRPPRGARLAPASSADRGPLPPHARAIPRAADTRACLHAACESCSLKTVCCPKVLDRRKDVRAYLARAMED